MTECEDMNCHNLTERHDCSNCGYGDGIFCQLKHKRFQKGLDPTIICRTRFAHWKPKEIKDD